MDYYSVDKEIYTFCEKDLPPAESKIQLKELTNKLNKLSKLELIKADNYDYKLKILEYHAQRHQATISFDKFMKEEHAAPIIRVGILPISFHEDDYTFWNSCPKTSAFPFKN